MATPRPRRAAVALSALAAALGACAADPPQDLLSLVEQEVAVVAPTLETAYRGDPYPRSVAEVEATLAPSGVELPPDVRVGGYRYDPEAVEFELCLEHAEGAWATYDTAPMALRRGGESGGCPAL